MTPLSSAPSMPDLPHCTRADFYASLGPPRQYGRWTRQTALIALGLYVREEHHLPPQRHLHNSESLPSYDTVIALFETIQAFYAALPPPWQGPIRPVGRAKIAPRAPRGHAGHAGRVTCRICEQPWDSPDAVLCRICTDCTPTMHEEGLWLTGAPVVMGGTWDDESEGESYGD